MKKPTETVFYPMKINVNVYRVHPNAMNFHSTGTKFSTLISILVVLMYFLGCILI